MKKSWPEHTLGKVITGARNFLRNHSPAWLNIEINPTPKAQEQLPPAKEFPFQGQPHWRRIAQVFQALDQATEEGITSYTALIDFVRETTGTGCSRKLVAKWKKERGI